MHAAVQCWSAKHPFLPFTASPDGSSTYLSALALHCRRSVAYRPAAVAAPTPCCGSHSRSARVAPLPAPTAQPSTLDSFLALLIEREQQAIAAALPLSSVAEVLKRLDSGTLAKPSCSQSALAAPDAPALLAAALRHSSHFASHPAVRALAGAAPSPAAAAARQALPRMASALTLASVLAEAPGLLLPSASEAELLAACSARAAQCASHPALLQRVPPALTLAAHCPALSAALLALQEAARTGDAVAQPPAAGLHPSFTLACLAALLGGIEAEGSSSGVQLQHALLLLSGAAKAPLLRSLLSFTTPPQQLLRLRVDKAEPLAALHTALGGSSSSSSSSSPSAWPPACPLHPTFAVQLPASTGSGQQNGGEGTVQDSGGEGQGPRRDFFHLCSSALASEHTAWQPLPLPPAGCAPYQLVLLPGEGGQQGAEATAAAAAAAARLALVAPPLPGSTHNHSKAFPAHTFELLLQQHQQSEQPAGSAEHSIHLHASGCVPATGELLLEEASAPLPLWLLQALEGGAAALPAAAPLAIQLRYPRTPCLSWSAPDSHHWPHTLDCPPSPSAASTQLALCGWLCAAALRNGTSLAPLALAPGLLAAVLCLDPAHPAPAPSPAALPCLAYACLLPSSAQSAVGGVLGMPPAQLLALLQAEGLAVGRELQLVEADSSSDAQQQQHWQCSPASVAAVASALAVRATLSTLGLQSSPAAASGGLPLPLPLPLPPQQSPLAAGFQAGTRGGLLPLLAALGLGGLDVCEAVAAPAARSCPLSSLFRVVRPREFAAAAAKTGSPAPLEAALWAVLRHWEAARPHLVPLFLAFVTGCPAPPAPGATALRIELPYTPLSLQEHREALGCLPSAHTCTHTLELPDYCAALRAVESEAAVWARADRARGVYEGLGVGEEDIWALACCDILGERLHKAVAESGGAYGVE